MDRFLTIGLIALTTPLLALIAMVPALFVALPAVCFGQITYDVAVVIISLAGGFWAARELAEA